MSRNNVRTWIVLSIGLSLGVAPFLVRGDQATRDRLEQNRQAIASMTQSERDRLDRNFEAYKLMDAQEISTLKAFHQKLSGDRSSELVSVLDQYHAWLETIQPYQRDKLKETADPQQRIALMNEIIKEQRSRDAARFLHDAYQNTKDDQRTRFWTEMLRHVPILNESDFSSLMEGLEKNESLKFTSIGRTKLDQLEGLDRYILLLDLIKESTNVRSTDPRRLGQIVLPQLQPAFEKMAQTFDSYVENSRAKDFVSQSKVGKYPQPESMRIQGLILKSLLVHAAAKRHNAEVVSQSELETLFDDLSEEVQDELLELESIDFYKELITQERATRETLDSLEIMRPFMSKDQFVRLEGRWHSSASQNGGFNGDGRGRPGGFGRPGGRPSGRGEGGRLDRDGKPLFRGDGNRRPNGERPGPPPRPREEADKS